MPHHKSCIKRLRQAEEDRIRNNAVKTVLRKTIKDARAKLSEGETIDLNQLYANIDTARCKGAVHKKRAARLKSRMAKAVAREAQKAS